MKIVCLSDTHGIHNFIPMPPGDILVHAGDFTGMGREEEIKSFAEWLRKLDYKHKIVIAGNHDVSLERDTEEALKWLGDSCVYLNNSGITIDGVNFWGSPIHSWFTDVWAFGRKSHEIGETWDKIPQNTDFLITHGAPSGILDDLAVGGHSGCDKLLEKVKEIKPKVHIFGHIHENGGMVKRVNDTLFMNVAVVNINYQLVRGPITVDLEIAPKEKELRKQEI